MIEQETLKVLATFNNKTTQTTQNKRKDSELTVKALKVCQRIFTFQVIRLFSTNSDDYKKKREKGSFLEVDVS